LVIIAERGYQQTPDRAANLLISCDFWMLVNCQAANLVGTSAWGHRFGIRTDGLRRTTMIALDFKRQLEGYGLTTASILYGMPDHPSVLQTFVWQAYDLAPRFPALTRFLEFWKRELDGPLRSVSVAHQPLIRPAEVRMINSEFRLH
jgi:uncharacterized protein Usg